MTGLEVPARIGWDLEDPPDGTSDPANSFYHRMEDGTDALLPAALTRAVSTRHLLWVLTVEQCDAYARVVLRRGIAYQDGPTPTVTIASDSSIPSVGTVDTGMYETSRGIALSPVSAQFDSRADTQETRWIRSYNVSVKAAMTQPSRLEGSFGLAVDPDEAEPPIAEALARTLMDTADAHPECPGQSCLNQTMSLVLGVFDPNGDRVYEATEIRDSGEDLGPGGWLSFFGLAAWHDLLAPGPDGQLVYWPSHDMEPDTTGMVYAFSATEVLVSE